MVSTTMGDTALSFRDYNLVLRCVSGIGFITLPNSFYNPSLSNGLVLASIHKDSLEAAPVQIGQGMLQ